MRRQPPFLESAAAGRILDLTPSGVRLLARTKRLPVAALTSRGTRLFRASHVEALRQARETARQQPPANPVLERQEASHGAGRRPRRAN